MPPPKKAAPTATRAAVPAKAIPTKAAAQATITLKHLAATLANSHDLARKQAQAVLGDLVTLATRHFKRGDKIRLTGLGILRVRKRAEPRAREAVKIKASKKIAFRPAKELKDAV
jgi:DNA-binding protein HU-beta